MIAVLNKKLAEEKNAAEDKWIFSDLKDGLQMISHEGEAGDTVSLEVEEKVVQYFFCLEGSIEFAFYNGAYKIDLSKGENFFFYNPDQKLAPAISLTSDSKLVFIFCSLEKIHELFVNDSYELEFLKSENVNQKFYKKDPTSSDLEVVLNQIVQAEYKGHTGDVFKYAKVLEVLSLYFSSQAREDNVSCPYINDEDSIKKIKQAKDILVDRMTNPPMISELAKAVDLNEFRLKEGFKSLYGATLFQYLLDHKMNKGRSMLDSGRFKVKEVAYDLGYNNPSHFISAFKNKFGVTPKKYLQKV